jgi:uncharacterized protein YcbK (DUF882 family)
MNDLSRRSLLGFGLAAASTLVVGHALAAPQIQKKDVKKEVKNERRLVFHALNTGEKFEGTYWEKGGYLPDALTEIRRVLRDHRNDEQHDIDNKLLDLLVAMRAGLQTGEPIEVISGYRSAASNEMMREEGHRGVAPHSYHMLGQAIDIRVPGRSLRSIHNTVLVLAEGGVAMYPRSNFVHVDVGPVRHW